MQQQHTDDSRLFIAVIDDSPSICQLLAVSLSQRGYVVKTFTDPNEAVRTFVHERRFPLPNVLIVDVLLQKQHIDGYEVVSRFRKAANGGEAIYIIVLSRLKSIMDRLLMKLAGSDVYVSKPFQIQEIVALIQQYEIRTQEAQGKEEEH